jgi:hypothetical protein
MRTSLKSPAAVVALAATLLLAGPIVADEILHFTNGTTMPVKSHTVVKGMIHVELDQSSYLAFPLSQIAKVTRGGEEIDLVRSIGERNRMAASHAINTENVDAGSSVEGGVEQTMEEKVRAYTEAARNGRTAAAAPRSPGLSNSANGIRSIEMSDGESAGNGMRNSVMGSSQNLSGRRIGMLRPNQRKTVGGNITMHQQLPNNNSRVELVGKSRAGSSGGSTNSTSSTNGGSSGNGGSN